MKTGFLDLPAEIRNEIYAYLLDEIDTNVGPQKIRLRPRTEFGRHWSRKNPHRGDVYSLNQVCRTTRYEFGPLYISQISHRVRVDEQLLPRFIQDFLLLEGAFALRPQRIEIELVYPLGVQPPRINVLPLLALCFGNENLHCTFLNKFGPMPEIDGVFWHHAVPWGEAILDDLLEIVLSTPHGNTTVVDLVFRTDCGRDFIDQIQNERPERAPSSMHGYLVALAGAKYRPSDAGAGVWNPRARIDFVVSKRAASSKNRRSMLRDKAFETQYRLIEN